MVRAWWQTGRPRDVMHKQCRTQCRGSAGGSAGSRGHVCCSTFLELGEMVLGKAMQAAMRGLCSLIPVLVLENPSPGAPGAALSRSHRPSCPPCCAQLVLGTSETRL